MDWFHRLNEYFPVEEMKAKEQMEALLKDKPEHYYKDESDLHIMMYAEFADFVFVDFLWVSEKARGKGIGKKLIQQLKDKRKTIILEVEPANENNEDSGKRLRFYFREGFKVSEAISYQFQALVSHSETELDIMYWDEQAKTDEQLMEYMRIVYEEIHSYRQKQIYGYEPKPTSAVLKLKAEQESPMQIQGINHLLFSVSNLEKSIVFYRDVLHAKLLVKGRSTAYFDLNGIWLALNEEKDIPRNEIEASYTHLAFSVKEEELKAWEQHLKQSGVHILEGRKRAAEDKQSIYFTDLDGHKLELHTGTLQDRLGYYQNEKKHMRFYLENINNING